MMRAALFSACLAACSSSNPPAALPPDASSALDGAIAPTDGAVADSIDAAVDRGVEQDYDDLAQTLAGIVRAPQLAAMQDGVTLGYSAALPGFTTVQPGEVAGTREGVSYDYMFHCEDLGHIDNFDCGPASDHIHVYATIDGPWMIDQLAFSSVKLTTRWTIREIYLNKPQVEGTAQLVTSSSLSTTGTKLDLTVDCLSFDHVRLDPVPTLPFAGGVTYMITAHRERATATPPSRDFTASAAITFAAGARATIALDGTHTYSLNLANGTVSRQ